MTDIVDRLNDSLSAGYSELRKEAAAEITRLRARIKAMEKQVPVCVTTKAYLAAMENGAVRYIVGRNPVFSTRGENDVPLYALPGAQPVGSIKDAIIDGLQSQFDTEGITEHDSGAALIRLSDAIAAVEDNFAQPAPIAQDTSVRKAWARFSNELHRSPDAPYPGMADAFERHFSQSFTDREWRAESATWAAAWKAAKRHEAQVQPAPSMSSVPEGWKEGVEDVAAMLQKKADDYADEYGYDDMGGLSFGGGMGGEIKMDYYNNLIELIEEVRAMLAAAPESKP